jgi:hypothetical protein
VPAPDVVGGAYANVETFDHHSSLTGYNCLSLSLALGIVKRQPSQRFVQIRKHGTRATLVDQGNQILLTDVISRKLLAAL